MNQPYQSNLPYPARLGWGSLLSNTYGIYRKQFWTFFRIGLPVALLTYLFSPIRRMLFRHQWDIVLARNWLTDSAEFWILFTVVTFITGGVYWILSTTV